MESGGEAAEGFVGGDGDGVGEVDGARVVAGHGDAGEAVGVARVVVRGKSGGFAAEDQCAGGGEGGLVERALGLGAEEAEGIGVAVGEVVVEAVVEGEVEVGPVVEAGAADVAFVEG